MTVVVRPIVAADQADWRRLWTGYLDYYEQNLDEQVYAKAFETLLANEPTQFQGLIAELDGKPCGIAHFVFHPNLWYLDDVCYLHDLFCDRQARGHGVARALIAEVNKLARERGAKDLYWNTEETNKTARLLYDKVAEKLPLVIYTQYLK
jgi:GNAT superfamily N-acetyltransferase